ncbi:hypothetical protein CS344_20275 [Bordetella bronchiseptica]|uniref:hypothetical protein n=1 Tax=Bordetella bronchiseptica TaxID=518 RepID=UPI000FD86A1A|nr:hypothetical protein [Bordetella bronchiseptica]AZW14250.1 hypothetical protein CS344_20275 [Bordetella bronchiseptica]QBS70785.1 hypothetical protein B2C13_19965 [Bordetella bronchiseptica]
MPYDPMNQVHPGPLEGIDRIPSDATQARTGNTEREQETWFAGVEEGQRRTEHNAAVRRSADGWKLVPIEPTAEMWAAVSKLDDEMAAGAYDGKGASIEQVWNCLVETAPESPPITVALDPDPRGVSVGVWQGSRCIYSGAHAVPVAPGDAQDDIDVLNWLQIEISALSCRYLGDPSYDHDAYWMRDRVLKLIDDAHKAFAAPAAGDARDAARYRWLTGDSDGNAQDDLIQWLARTVTPKQQIDERIDAAIAAQQGNKTGTNSGHGHVWDRPDGLKARCGGPGFCSQCSRDQAAQQGKGGEV